jgi:NAD(P)-dependent dehydrogenase (short-subunit alcohol dehydrogenase family)
MRNRKVWFITGVSKGFGLEIAKAALRSGDKVVGTVRRKPKHFSAALLNATDFLLVRMDVTREKEVISGVQEAVRHFGRIDVVVNNACFGMIAAIEEATDAETRQQFDTNVFGVLNVVRAALPDLRRQRSGHVINVSSFFGYDVLPGWGLYGATKFAVEGISKGLALELAPFGIHVTAVAPGLFSTGFVASGSCSATVNIIEDYVDTAVGNMRVIADQLNGRQPGDPEKLADVVVQLANLENPPTHLPIGRDAVAMFRNNVAKTTKEINQWEELSCCTDHLRPIFHVKNFKYE